MLSPSEGEPVCRVSVCGFLAASLAAAAAGLSIEHPKRLARPSKWPAVESETTGGHWQESVCACNCCASLTLLSSFRLKAKANESQATRDDRPKASAAAAKINNVAPRPAKTFRS